MMSISTILDALSDAFDSVRGILVPIPGILMLCTAMRRPGLSAILISAKIYADMHQNENDDIVKKFVLNVVDKIKTEIQDNGVCFVIIPPGELKFMLFGSNALGPVIFKDSQGSSIFKNLNYVVGWGIMR